jgi:uncharacterized phage infection (PIP) family protein YhgE
LSQQIEKIAMNSLLQPPSKLSQIYRAIAKFYTTQIADAQAVAQSTTDSYIRAKDIVNQFSVELSLLLSMDAVTFDDFVDRNGAQKIFQKASQVMKAFEEANRRNQQFTALADHIAELFGQSPDLFARVSSLRKTIDEQASLIKYKGKKRRELRNRLRDLKTSTDSEIGELTAKNVALKETLEELQGNLAEADALIKKLKKALSHARQELKDLEISLTDTELTLKSDHERFIDRLQGKHSAVQQQLNQYIETLTSNSKRHQRRWRRSPSSRNWC